MERKLGRLDGLARLALVSALLLVGLAANAATLNIDGGGQLLGASNVDVDGVLYDVEFLDGTCVSLFSGCDDAEDFTFSSTPEANLASQALLDQVLLDSGLGPFDTDPSLVNGCEDPTQCEIRTLYGPIFPANGDLSLSLAFNGDTVSGDFQVAITSTDADSSLEDFAVYARWSPVPEPGTGVLIGLGLAALSASRGRDQALGGGARRAR